MFSHNRIAHQPIEKLEVTIRPWSNIDRDVLSVRHDSLRFLILPAYPPTLHKRANEPRFSCGHLARDHTIKRLHRGHTEAEGTSAAEPNAGPSAASGG